MADASKPLRAQVARLSRRTLVGAVAGGALLGSAWAAGLRDAVIAGSDVHVTIARTASAYGVLFEHQGHRIMLIDAADGPGASTVTELSTGIMAQRIDSLWLTADAAASLSRDYRERWNIRDIVALPDRRDAGPSSLAGRSLRIGDLSIVSDALPLGMWRAKAAFETDWYVAASFGRTRVVVASSGTAIARLPLDAIAANAIVCIDTLLELGVAPPGIDALLVPVEVADALPEGVRVVALSRNASTTLRLREDRIETP